MNIKANSNYPDISLAREILALYKREKGELETRLAAESRAWENVYTPKGSASWIFNSIVNKHADIVDSMPACSCLPRESRDERYAEVLSKVLPVIIERAGFEEVYSDNAWDKLKHGTAVYGVFWNPELEEGMGDIDIRRIRLSDIYWDMGVTDIQDSKNLFIVSSADGDALQARYPHFDPSRSRSTDAAMMSLLGYSDVLDERCVVIDWYYKRYPDSGSVRLELCKFCGDEVLYSSEADESCLEGWYEHGKYPVVFDRLYPCESGACGFGVISIASDAQEYVNQIDENVLAYSDWASRVRFWAKRSLGVNEKEFLDLDRSIVEVEGDIDEEKLRQIEIAPMEDFVIDFKRMKIDEIKEITGSRDVSQGGITGGVTAAAAISVLREAGAKSSRDGIEASYRAYERIVELVIELIAQFYSSDRIFRITGDEGDFDYLSFSGRSLKYGEDGLRPHFDIEIEAAKKSPSEAQEKNAFVKELYDSGAFKRENAKETLLMLELMDFEGAGRLKAALHREYGELETV